MEDYNPEYNLGDMTEDQKDELIQTLAQNFNTMSVVAISLHNAVEVLAGQLIRDDAFGTRASGMRDAVKRMRMVAAIARMGMGLDEAQLQADAEFEDIISRLEED